MTTVQTVATALRARGFTVQQVRPASITREPAVIVRDKLRVDVGVTARYMEVVEEHEPEAVYHGLRCGSVDMMLAAVVRDLREILGEEAPAGAQL